MSVQLFTGDRPVASWVYTALEEWRYSVSEQALTIVEGLKTNADKTKLAKRETHSFTVPELIGTEIAGLMQDHAAEIAKARPGHGRSGRFPAPL